MNLVNVSMLLGTKEEICESQSKSLADICFLTLRSRVVYHESKREMES